MFANDFDWNYPPLHQSSADLVLCGRISKHCGKSRPDKCDLLRQRLLSESAYPCAAIIGLLTNGSFFESFLIMLIYFFLGLVCYDIFHELKLVSLLFLL